MVQTTADGAKGFLSWYDDQLKIQCSFQRASDDTQRCLPWPSIQVSIVGAGVEYYSDMSCSTQVTLATGPAGCTGPYAVESISGAACNTVTGYATTTQYRVHSILGPLTGLWYKPTPTASCMRVTIPASQTYYSVDPSEVAPSTFATGSIVIE